jgi:hypothetical protein
MIRATALATLLLAAAGHAAAGAADTPTLLLVRGAPGEPEYATNTQHQVALWQATAERANAHTITIGADDAADDAPTDRDRLQQALAGLSPEDNAPLWLVLIGHGTFDGKTARFNLRGPDVDAAELAAWLTPLTRPTIVLNTASASAPFIHALSSPNRIIVTATRSGSELNYTRFGRFLAEALANPDSDFDRDGQTSLLEAFLAASAQVREFYATEGRLATEHALLDDNGDGKGTPAEWFRGVRARRQPNEDADVDGARAHQVHLVLSSEELRLSPETRAQRDALEQQVFDLRARRAEFPDEEQYLTQLETLLLELARVYHPPAEEP